MAHLIGRSRLRALYQDTLNLAVYGRLAPRYAERIWVDVDPSIRSIGKGKKFRGRVIHEWPPRGAQNVQPIMDLLPIQSCIEHWENNVRWEDTPVFDVLKRTLTERGSVDGCKSVDDLVRRYRRLDAIFSQVKIEKRIRSKAEMPGRNFRELGGICFHIGPQGEPFFGRLGQHRLAMALIAGISRIPAELGGVYVTSLPMLADLRNAGGST